MQLTCQSLLNAINTSPYLESIEHANRLFNNRFQLKSVDSTVIERLKSNGNSAEKWNNIKQLSSESIDVSNIKNCRFEGVVILGSYNKTIVVEGVSLHCGLYNSIIKDSIIGDNCLIVNTSLLSNSVLHNGVVVQGCGLITCSGKTSFANGIEIPVGVEVGGRDIPCFAEMNFDDAVSIGSNRHAISALNDYGKSIRRYKERAHSQVNIFCENTQLLNSARVKDVFLGSYGIIKGGDLENVTILSSLEEKSSITGGCFIRNSIHQWGTSTDSMAIVRNSFLCEYSYVNLHGKLFESILGPNSSISEGECTSSLVGPFVGFHHQALLIACFWPSGKGNIGYGANVGSNHTLKAPDQELWPGEGVFFGLGVSIKYPSNFVKSPYAVVATGVSTLPQAVEMPFALINIPGDSIKGISPAINEIFPGWVLGQCIFAILRNEVKFATRNKAKRCHIESEILRPTIIDMMLDARQRLQTANSPRYFNDKGEGIYTDREIRGLGKNYVTQANLDVGIETYTFYIRHYALNGLHRRLLQGDSVSTVLTASCEANSRWQHERNLLHKEFPETNVQSLLEILFKSQKTVAKSAEVGKSRDDKRGVSVIPDYALVHKQACKEPIVISAQKYADSIGHSITKLLSNL